VKKNQKTVQNAKNPSKENQNTAQNAEPANSTTPNEAGQIASQGSANTTPSQEGAPPPLTTDQRIQRLETALGNLIAYLDQQTKQPAGNLGQPQQQQGDLQALLALAGPLLKEPDPMQQLTLTFLQGAVQNQNAMAQATINLANSIATIFVKKKIEGETT